MNLFSLPKEPFIYIAIPHITHMLHLPLEVPILNIILPVLPPLNVRPEFVPTHLAGGPFLGLEDSQRDVAGWFVGLKVYARAPLLEPTPRMRVVQGKDPGLDLDPVGENGEANECLW